MAHAAQSIWWERGVLIAFPGLVIGAITGIILALTGATGI